MRRSILQLLIAFSLLLTASTSLAIQLSAPDSVRPMLEKYLSFLHEPVPTDEIAQSALIHRAENEISDLLATEGYFSPQISTQNIAAERQLTIHVEPGPRTTIRQVSLQFTGHIAQQAERLATLRTVWSLTEGSPFQQSEWDAAKRHLLREISDRDYAAARIVESRAEINPKAALADLSLVIDSGPPFRFGELRIEGLQRYETKLVMRYTPFRPGDPYRKSALFDFQSRLQNTPYFSAVIVNIDTDPAEHEHAPIHVSLTEAPSKRLGLGTGYSTNYGARAETQYQNHNFFSNAWDLGSGLRLEEKRQELYANIAPPPNPKGYRLLWGGKIEQTDIAGLKTNRVQLNVARTRLEGSIEKRWGLDWQRETRQPTQGVKTLQRALVLNWTWIQRKIDNPLDPRQGHIIEVRLGGAAKHVLSDQNFLRSYARTQGYWPIGAHDVLTLRGELGFTAAPSRTGIPQEYLFRAGGSGSVRGYAYQSLGLKENSAIVGGRTLATASAEYTHWFSHDWGGAVFTDVGNAADRWKDMHLVSGYGVGARWRSPAGPLALDIAYGNKTQKWRLHFGIAIAF